VHAGIMGVRGCRGALWDAGGGVGPLQGLGVGAYPGACWDTGVKGHRGGLWDEGEA